jgi:hypothetical protein
MLGFASKSAKEMGLGECVECLIAVMGARFMLVNGNRCEDLGNTSSCEWSGVIPSSILVSKGYRFKVRVSPVRLDFCLV